MSLLEVNTFVISRSVAEASLAAIQQAGRAGRELFVAWSGVQEHDTFTFCNATIPRQVAHRTEHGLLVTLDGDSLFELNRVVHSRGELLAGQIHAHPDSAYHSPADDALAIVTVAGGLSFVIPDFARAGMRGVNHWACFQLGSGGQWGRPANHVSMRIE